MDVEPSVPVAGRAIGDLIPRCDVDVDGFTGGATLSVSVPVSPDRSGSGPSLTLTYSSAGGNSVLGMGWSLGYAPAISIDTSDALPRYDASDRFEFGGQELVPELTPSGDSWVPRTGQRDGFLVEMFRGRVTGTPLRVERWTRTVSGQAHWRVRDEDGTVTIYGRDEAGTTRIADPGDARRIFSWLPESRYDAVGNAIRFDYVPDDVQGLDAADSFEHGLRTSAPSAQRYLKRIRYGPTVPLGPDDPGPADLSWHFEVVLDYGDHADALSPSAAPDRPWPARRDAFSTFRPGFELRTRRLCRRILMFHRFDELGPSPVLIGSTTLTHTLDPAGATLDAVQHAGHRGTAARIARPAMTFRYSRPVTDDAFRQPEADVTVTLPQGLTGPRHQMTDFFGDGLPGILTDVGAAWYYQRNRGGGRFGPREPVPARPVHPGRGAQLTDFDGDGNTDSVVLQGVHAGSARLDRATGTWAPFLPFRAIPRLDAVGRRVQWIDINGDGQPDLVISHADRFTWYPSAGRDGFEPAVEIPKPQSAGMVQARQVTEDAERGFFWADMNGDGLLDLVRVENGRVEYWPHLGRGRFGDGVLMDGAPHLGTDDQFDPQRLHFADLDGSGTADLVYIGAGWIRRWTNASGNRLIEAPTMAHTPYIEDLAGVSVLDFLADGTSSLVWSSSLPGAAGTVRQLRLTGSVRPRLLLGVDNGTGHEVRLTWSSSAAHYLRDVASGRGWRSTLPSHVLVVDRREDVDQVSGRTTVTRYEYHDGCFDGGRRRFLGFGLVDTFDTAAQGADPSPSVTPACRRTWYHPGAAWPGPGADGYQGDARAPVIPADDLGDAAEQGRLTADEFDDARRAVAGQPVRRELYAVLGTGERAAHPLHVVQTCYRPRRLQPGRGTAPAAFHVHQQQRLTSVYEQEPDDPRHVHHLVLDLDTAGNTRLDANVGYARRTPPAGAPGAQRTPSITVSHTAFVSIDDLDRFEPGLPYEYREFETAGIAPGVTGVFTPAGLASVVTAALAAPLDMHEPFTLGPQLRLAGWDRTIFWNEDHTAALPPGSTPTPALVHHEESACFTTPFVDAAFAGLVDAPLLASEGRYTEHDGYWWRADAVRFWTEAARFRQLARLERADGATTTLRYDEDAVALVAVEDAAGNRTRATSVDYHLLAADQVTDPNDNLLEVRCDALGVAVTTTWHGDLPGPAGVHRYGFDALSEHQAQPATPAAMLADPARFVQGAARHCAYDLDSWAVRREPVGIVTARRESLTHDGPGGGSPSSPTQLTVEYLDGFGRTLQRKLRVEPGPAVQRDAGGQVIVDAGGTPVRAEAAERWLTSGNVQYDVKQQVAQEYEPFFSDRPAYEGDAVLRSFGVSTLTVFDAAGRDVQHFSPDGTFIRNRYGAWRIEYHDAHDTIQESRYRLERELLPDDDPRKQALRKAQEHAGTPMVVELDPDGRVVRRTENGTGGEQRVIDLVLHHTGHPLIVTDARRLPALTCSADLLGRVPASTTADAGTSLVLYDAYDRSIREWDARGVQHRRTFDVLDRPTAIVVRVPGPGGVLGGPRTVEELRYGDDPAVPDAAARNLRGQCERHRDSAGVRTIDRCDPAGAVLRETRKLCLDPLAQPDWAVAGVPLDPASHASERILDGLDRVVEERLPDGSTRRIAHLAAGGARQIVMSTDDALVTDVELLSEASVNARGQQLSALLGNGVRLDHDYDPETFDTTGITAAVPGAPDALLDLTYTRDPAGNVTRVVDAAQEPDRPLPLLQGISVTSRQDFTYDAYYQLIRAEGRVHQALLQHDYRPGLTAAGAVKGTRHLSFNNGAAVERYTQTYQYDLGGNLRQLRHLGPTKSWTTEFWISGTSNRSVPQLTPAGTPVADPAACFDASGNCVELAHLRELTYDHRGMPARAVTIRRTSPGATDDAETYVYDGAGRRARKVAVKVTAGGVEVTEKIYLDGCEITRIRLGGTLVLERVSSLVENRDSRLALVHRWTVDTAGRQTDDVTRPRFHYQVGNRLGTSLMDLDETGKVIGYEEYFPFGGTAFIVGDDLRDVALREYRYCGKERDDATGLDYVGHRYYASWIGRWISPDPAGPEDSPNLYTYVHNDPVNLTDPDGLRAAGPAGPATGGLTRVELTPQEAAFLEVRRQQAFDRLPKARQEVLLRRGCVLSFNRNLEFQFHTPAEARAQIARRSPTEKIGIIAGPERPPPEAAAAPPGKADGDPLVLAQPPPQVTPPATGEPAGPVTDPPSAGETPAAADGTAADGTGTGRATDAAASAPAGDGGTAGTGGGTGDRGTGTGAGGSTADAGISDAGTEQFGPGTGTGAARSGPGADPDAGPEETPDQETPDQPGTGNRTEAGTGTDPAVDAGVIPEAAGDAGGVVQPGAATGGSDVGESGTVNGAGRTSTDGGDGSSGAGAGGGKDGRGREKRTILDNLTQAAGWTNLEFGGDKGGVAHGIPGGFGSHDLGAPAQAAYVVISAIQLAFGIAELKAIVQGIAKVGLKTSISLAVKRARSLIPAAKAAMKKLAAGAGSRVKGIVSAVGRLGGRRLVEYSGGKGIATVRRLEDLTLMSGRTAQVRNAWIRGMIDRYLPKLKLTFVPQYNPRLAPFGISEAGKGTQIGKKAFQSMRELLDTIVHEELHHRWFKQGLVNHHSAKLEPYLEYTVKKYMQIRGWIEKADVPLRPWLRR
jgi:RHS repeat-associated protein